ncbi:DUF4189 domain-containing protein [Octadecabacter sp. 1_MG-2023]|uniref:DUF4189 domain-containing protein n=1 Tax=unclassified Octadecabacter TaxID=196158 RepID=UPI001C0812ED|nr:MULTISPECIES: DUF4189 domain-containing protein [unclassified Octadecabacter]MBU2992616.1 DUF4189 domain-containing protein [Octadecabacter sp. B2R22]MDO6734627.1 DUF4189 domain-containing protein [Octadecabacter sp. 1_MG-2023]
MIVEFVIAATLTLPTMGPSVTQVEFREPIREVVTYPPVGVLEQASGLRLPDEVRSVFEEDFLEGHVYFGAFAITKEFGYGYVTGANSIEAARDIAIEECLKQGAGCLIFAELYPEGYVPLEDGQVSLAPEAAAYFNNPGADWGTYRAMAVSEDGAYAIVWDYETPAAAAAAALADCEEYVITNLPNLRSMPCVLIPFK